MNQETPISHPSKPWVEPPTFSEWVMSKAQYSRDDEVGMIARAIVKDRSWPSYESLEGILNYVESKWEADDEIVSALRRSFAEYFNETNQVEPVERPKMTETQRQNAEALIAAHVAGGFVQGSTGIIAKNVAKVSASIAKQTVEALND